MIQKLRKKMADMFSKPDIFKIFNSNVSSTEEALIQNSPEIIKRTLQNF